MEKADNIDLQIQNLNTEVNRTFSQLLEWDVSGDEWINPAWNIEQCFVQLLTIIELLELSELRKIVYNEFIKGKDDLTITAKDPDGDTFSPVISRIRFYIGVLEKLFPSNKKNLIIKNLIDILRDIHYTITDKTVFTTLPQNENDVHIRIEAILKSVFPDLKHKPKLTKIIKNFEPDTGITSLQTLIEYKFLSDKKNIGQLADELLADTRGYNSQEWKQFIFVIYETNRFRTEKDWNLFLRQSKVPNNTIIVVLSGEPTK